MKNNGEVLLLTQPDAVEDVHRRYFAAGADIVETNTFGATTIGQHDFFFRHSGGKKDQAFFEEVVNDPFLQELVREMNLAAVRLARKAADGVGTADGAAEICGGGGGADAGDVCRFRRM